MISNLLDRMKLPFRKNKEFLTALYHILGFYPHNIEVYRIAFSHKSLTYRRPAAGRKPKDRKPQRTDNTSKPLNNERLEYLGDAILEAVVSDILFRHFSHKREGFLTSTRSKIVQRESLNRLAAEMGLERLIQAAQGTRMTHTNIGGNAFEALMGAIYLDRGYAHCHWFVANRVIGHYVDLENVAQKEVNFKSKLLEWSQKNRINIVFKDAAVEGDEKGFGSTILIEGIVAGQGSGRSKKESQQVASKEALTRMRRDAKMYDSLFRAKEKRTAMEAEESFALPKIEEIEESLQRKSARREGRGGAVSSVLPEAQKRKRSVSDSDAAYDTAYDESAEYEVIDTPSAESELTADDNRSGSLSVPSAANDMDTLERQPKKRKNRTPKTVDAAVKDFSKKKGNENGAKTQPEAEKTQSASAARPKKAVKDAPSRQQNADGNGPAASNDAQPSAKDAHEVPNDAHEVPNDAQVVARETQPFTSQPLSEEEAQRIAEEKRKSFEERQAAQRARYEAEKARRAERKAQREAAQEPLQVATAVISDEKPVLSDLSDLSGKSDLSEESDLSEKSDLYDRSDVSDNPKSSDNTEISETSDFSDETVEKTPMSFSHKAPKPILRHIPLDDFVFGVDDDNVFDVPMENEEAEAEVSAPAAKPRKRRRKSGAKGAKTENTPTAAGEQPIADVHAETDVVKPADSHPEADAVASPEAADTADAADASAGKPKRRRRRRRPAKKIDE